MSVKIVGYQLKQNKKGEDFVVLELQGDLVMIQSSETGRFYASAKKCSMTSTFSEEAAKTLIGREIPGRIEKVECEEYSLIDQESGEVTTLSYRYEFIPEGVPTPLRVVSANIAA